MELECGLYEWRLGRWGKNCDNLSESGVFSGICLGDWGVGGLVGGMGE